MILKHVTDSFYGAPWTDSFYVAPLSASEQIHCALITCDSEGVTSFTQCLLNIHQSGILTALFSCYMAGAT